MDPDYFWRDQSIEDLKKQITKMNERLSLWVDVLCEADFKLSDRLDALEAAAGTPIKARGSLTYALGRFECCDCGTSYPGEGSDQWGWCALFNGERITRCLCAERV